LLAPFDREWFGAQQAKSETAVVADAPLQPPTSGHPGTSRREEWGEAPDILDFQNRLVELTTLQNWLRQEQCRLVALLGIGGIGKSVLAAHVLHTRSLLSSSKCTGDVCGTRRYPTNG
jgi:hypothetical protein